ncbi:MAG: hypothetical protein QNK05_13355 [Myxococcota bacterium]|nr:hypothetical protein [Myxococcota bacterium]
MAALAGSAAAIGATSSPADAAIIHVTGSPVVNLNRGGDEVWDVDGDGTTDFVLDGRSRVGYYSYSVSYTVAFDPQGSNRLVSVPSGSPNPNDPPHLIGLPDGFAVGGTLANYSWRSEPRDLLYWYTFAGSSYPLDVAGFEYTLPGGSGDVVGRFGFEFMASDGVHYGWADMRLLRVTSPLYAVVIDEWAWETTPGAPIAVGATSSVPEAPVSSLALLAAGAAGVRRWRMRRAEATRS